jgi:predicted nucleotidyltransferase
VNNPRSSLTTEFPGFLTDVAALIADRIGSEHIRGVFVCGSVASGEETIVRETEPPLMLSDIDLVVVVGSLRLLRAWYPRRAELGIACERLLGSVTFVGRVDVGVLLPDDLARLGARPGVYDMRNAALMLHGARTLLESIPDYPSTAIDGREAIVLIENRIAALLGSYPGEADLSGSDLYRFLYHVARIYTDLAVATLCIAGRYEPGYERRWHVLRELVESEMHPLAASLVSPEILSKVDRWTAFKLEPTAAALGVAPDAAVLRRVWIDSARDILWFWRQANSYRRDHAADLLHPYPVDSFGDSRRDVRRWRDHLRSWSAYLSRYPAGKRFLIAASIGKNLVAASPLDVVRERGVKLLGARLAFGSERPVRGAPFGFPHGGGRWERAAAELSSVWMEIVSGRGEM